MPNLAETMKLLNGSKIHQLFADLYGTEEPIIKEQVNRYQEAIHQFQIHFSNEDLFMFSAPGRTEIGGNHTDHNYGKVLTASIDCDSIAVAAKTNNGEITIYSGGYPEPFIVNIADDHKLAGEKGTTALLRGIVAGFKKFGHPVGGFNAYISSNVVNASGLSSSASIEMLICSIINSFYNDGKLDKVTFAKIGQYAENVFWNKPSGLLDQMACAVGGVIAIDFGNPAQPVVEKVDFDFAAQKYKVLIVNTGGNHADLTEEYAAIPVEMHAVAEFFGKKQCREITYQQVLDSIEPLRAKVGDRAILRAMHYFEDNRRVDEQVKALKNQEFQHFLELITESGNSSWKWLQNCYVASNPTEQGITLALAITENFIHKNKVGACRVHGGGFAGVIQTFLPSDLSGSYMQLMDDVFGQRSTTAIIIRPLGTININSTLD